MQHDEKWLNNIDCLAVHYCEEYLEHMMRLRPANEWHEDMGSVLWFKLPLCEEPYVGSPLDTGWDSDVVHILSNGETNAEYYTHFQIINVKE